MALLVHLIDEVDAKAKHVKEAKKLNIHVIRDTFFKECQKGGAAILIEQHSLAPWGGDVSTTQLQQEDAS